MCVWTGSRGIINMAPAGQVKRDPKQEAYMKQRKALIKKQNAESASAKAIMAKQIGKPVSRPSLPRGRATAFPPSSLTIPSCRRKSRRGAPSPAGSTECGQCCRMCGNRRARREARSRVSSAYSCP